MVEPRPKARADDSQLSQVIPQCNCWDGYPELALCPLHLVPAPPAADQQMLACHWQHLSPPHSWSSAALFPGTLEQCWTECWRVEEEEEIEEKEQREEGDEGGRKEGEENRSGKEGKQRRKKRERRRRERRREEEEEEELREE